MYIETSMLEIKTYQKWVRVEGWVNVYPGHTSVIYPTEARANEMAKMNDKHCLSARIACIFVAGDAKYLSE